MSSRSSRRRDSLALTDPLLQAMANQVVSCWRPSTSVVDSGNPLINGRNVARGGAVAVLTDEQSPVLGYSIVQAESMDEAVALLAECPMDMWVYEAMPM